MNQILILEDLGIPKTDFENLAQELPPEIIWDEESIQSPDAVEGIITVKTKVDQQLLAKYQNVKFIAVAFTGYDCVDLEICRQKNIAVFNVPAYSTNSVAELVVGLAISLFREIPTANNIIRSEKWALQPGQELSGKTVGILGTGTIGTLTASFFKTFGCKIIGWSRTEREEFKTLGEYIPDLTEFLSSADIISVHLPLTDETEGIIGEKEFSAMKETAYLINTARGPIIDENALIEALKDGKITGAAIDVFDPEPIDPNNELLKLSNIILTPHIAYKTVEALKRRAEVTISNIVDFMQGKSTNRVE